MHSKWEMNIDFKKIFLLSIQYFKIVSYEKYYNSSENIIMLLLVWA